MKKSFAPPTFTTVTLCKPNIIIMPTSTFTGAGFFAHPGASSSDMGVGLSCERLDERRADDAELEADEREAEEWELADERRAADKGTGDGAKTTPLSSTSSSSSSLLSWSLCLCSAHTASSRSCFNSARYSRIVMSPSSRALRRSCFILSKSEGCMSGPVAAASARQLPSCEQRGRPSFFTILHADLRRNSLQPAGPSGRRAHLRSSHCRCNK